MQPVIQCPLAAGVGFRASRHMPFAQRRSRCGMPERNFQDVPMARHADSHQGGTSRHVWQRPCGARYPGLRESPDGLSVADFDRVPAALSGAGRWVHAIPGCFRKHVCLGFLHSQPVSDSRRGAFATCRHWKIPPEDGMLHGYGWPERAAGRRKTRIIPVTAESHMRLRCG